MFGISPTTGPRCVKLAVLLCLPPSRFSLEKVGDPKHRINSAWPNRPKCVQQGKKRKLLKTLKLDNLVEILIFFLEIKLFTRNPLFA